MVASIKALQSRKHPSDFIPHSSRLRCFKLEYALFAKIHSSKTSIIFGPKLGFFEKSSYSIEKGSAAKITLESSNFNLEFLKIKCFIL